MGGLRRRRMALITTGLFGGAGDSTAPTVTLTVGAQNSAGVVACSAEFSEDVKNFVDTDISVTNGTAGTFVTVDAAHYTWNVTPTVSGTVGIQIPAGCCTDLSGKLNTASDLEEYEALIWLLLDTFGTDLTAGNVNGTLSDSGHTRTVTDTGNTMAIASGELKITAVSGIVDPYFRYATPWARVAGRMLRMKLYATNITVNRYIAGFSTTLSNPVVPNYLGVTGFSNGVQNVANASLSSGTQVAPFTHSTPFEAEVILRSTGFFLLLNGKLRWIGRSDTTTPLYVGVEGVNTLISCDLRADNLGVIDLDTTDPTQFPTPTLSDSFALPVAADASGNSRNGTYVNVGLDGAEGIGDGGVAASFRVGSPVINTYSASLAGAFNGAAGTILIWVKVKDAGVWTDGASRYIVHFVADGNNFIYFRKSSASNSLQFYYSAGSTVKSTIKNAVSTTDWMCLAITWDKAGDTAQAYYNGSPEGAAITGLGTWVGSLGSTSTLFGASSLTGTASLPGALAHAAVWTKALTPAEIAAIYAAPATQQATVLATQSANLIQYLPLNERYTSDGLAHVETGAGDGVTYAANANNWYASANKLYIVPQPGPELLTNGDFAAWTGDDPDGWTIGGEVGSDPMVTQVDPGGGAGTGAAKFLSHCNERPATTNTKP